MPGGSFIGAIVSGLLADKVGRKYAILVGACFWLIGSTISCAAQNMGMLAAGRFINGFCVGICSAQVPVYVSELAPYNLRGRMVGAQQWAITWGILIMYYISFGSSYLSGPAAFRLPWGVQMVPAVVLICLVPFLPRSPRWLASKDRWEEAIEVLAMVHGHGDKTHPLVEAEYRLIQEDMIAHQDRSSARYLELVKPQMLGRTIVGISCQIWSQLTGMNVMMYYISYVFQMAGLTGQANLISSSISFVINVVMTVPALIWLDTWGRRNTFMVGSTLMMIWMFIIGALFATYATIIPMDQRTTGAVSMTITGAPSKAVIACTYLFVASFAPTWGPAGWVYVPEIYPNRLRGLATGCAAAGNWMFNFALGYFVPPAFQNINWRTYMIFGAFNAAMTIHVFLMYPETAGKSLEEIEAIFTSEVPAWKTQSKAGEAKIGQTMTQIEHEHETNPEKEKEAFGERETVGADFSSA